MNAHRVAKPDLVRLFEGGSLAGLSDWQLLDRFVAARDELAFEALVQRHGPMVMGVCRRMLSNAFDAEDSFQATFLVLLRRAGSLGTADSLGPWLHGVAVKVAQQARGAAARRGRKECPGLLTDVPGPDPDPIADDPELRQILDQEIDRLPDRYRLPVVLCYLEGQTHEQAARSLEWPLGTVKGRLARARSLLESRLTRRGVACGAALAAFAAGSAARAAMPPALVRATCRAAVAAGSGTLLTSVVSTSVTRLAQGVVSTMIVQKLKLIAAAVAVSGVFFTGAGVLARQQGKDATPAPLAEEGPSDPSSPGPLARRAPEPKGGATPAAASPTRKPLDPKELYRRAIQEARRAFVASEQEFRAGKTSLDRVYLASRLLMDGERDAASIPDERLKAAEAHLDRMKALTRTHQEAGNVDDADGASVRAYLAEAELLISQAKTPPTAASVKARSPEGGPAPSSAPGKDAKSLALLARLEEPLAMSFPNETPLEDVLKYIKQATSSPNGPGIPIYIDPVGLQEAEKSMTSPVQLDLEGIPLRRTLQLMLSQLGLLYYVDDGILVITSQDSEATQLPPSSNEPSAFAQKRDRAERGEMSLEEMKKFVEELKIRKEMMNAITELQTVNETGLRGHPEPPKSQPTEAILKEIRELLGQIRAEREHAAKGK
jgi:RNA polymerase sigma factor (sigma-70 family)